MKTFKQLMESKGASDLTDMEKLAVISALGFGGSAEVEQADTLKKLEKMKLVKDIEHTRDVSGDHLTYDLTPRGKAFANELRKEKNAIMKRLRVR